MTPVISPRCQPCGQTSKQLDCNALRFFLPVVSLCFCVFIWYCVRINFLIVRELFRTYLYGNGRHTQNYCKRIHHHIKSSKALVIKVFCFGQICLCTPSVLLLQAEFCWVKIPSHMIEPFLASFYIVGVQLILQKAFYRDIYIIL